MPTIQTSPPPAPESGAGRFAPADRALLLGLRQACLIALGALEVRLGLPRSAPPKHCRGGQCGQARPAQPHGKE